MTTNITRRFPTCCHNCGAKTVVAAGTAAAQTACVSIADNFAYTEHQASACHDTCFGKSWPWW